jgi:PIN domain nuclease of toxin-antitoxin system
MAAILDTHAFLWLVSGDPRLSAAAREYAKDPANPLWLSAASGWEIGIKFGLGRLQLDLPLSQLLTESIARLSLHWLGIKPEHVAAVASLPRHHGDPFDRMLVAQCHCERVALLSSDATLDAYGVTRIW